jgi:hypothetical protein
MTTFSLLAAGSAGARNLRPDLADSNVPSDQSYLRRQYENLHGVARMKGPAVLALSAVAIAAAIDLRVALRGDPDSIPIGAMKSARARIDAEKKPGDQVVHSPLFSMEELAGLGDLSARPDRPVDAAMRSRRVLVLDRSDQRMYLPGAPAQVIALDDPLELRIYEPSENAEVAIFDLFDGLSDRSMRIERNGRITSRCTRARAEGGYQCPGEPEWLYAAQRTFRVGSADGTCVWAHPTTNGAILFEIPGQPRPPEGRKLELIVSAGLADDAVTGTPGGAAVTTEITQGGAKVGSVVVPNRVGWFETRIEIDPESPVELRITTPRDGRRHHCINAKVMERPK